jgi:chromosome segregation ATPase
MAQPSSSAASAVVRLEVRAGRGQPTVYEVGDGGFLVGSVPGCDLRLAGANLPPVLCLLSCHPGGASLRKLAPVLPLTVNGKSVTAAYLHDGDRVSLGSVEIGVEVVRAGDAATPDTQPADIDARLRQIVEREKELAQQSEDLEADRIGWVQRRGEIEEECRRERQAAEELARRIAQEARELAADRAKLEAQRDEQATLEPRAAAVARAEQEVGSLRGELTEIRRQLLQRYQQRRDRLAGQKVAVFKAARRVQDRKRQVDAQAAELARQQKEWNLRQEEIKARGEQVERERQLLDEQHRAVAGRLQEGQRVLAERVGDLEAREAKLAEERAQFDKGQKQHQADLVRLDRLQAGIDQRRKQLEARALEVDHRFEQLQRDSRDLEEQAKQLDEWHKKLTAAAEQLEARKKEQENSTQQSEQRAATLEGQQAMLTTLRTRLERMREELRRQEQEVSDQRVLQQAGEEHLRQHTEEAQRLRVEVDNDRQLFDEERRRFAERSATLETAVAKLRQAQEAIEPELEELKRRKEELDATAAEQAEQAGMLLARAGQLDELHTRLTADRQALKEREATLTKAEQTLATLQEQVRRRSEELNERQKQVEEKETRQRDEAARLEAERKTAEEEQRQGAAQLEQIRDVLAAQVEKLEIRASDVAAREEAAKAEQQRLEDALQSLASQRQAHSAERIAWEVERQAAQEQDRQAKLELESARAETAELAKQLPDLEARAAEALERLTRGRELLREHLAEVHNYARQSREDLEAARRHLQAEAERVRQHELALQVARDEHRLAVAGFRQQLIEWQGQVGEIKQSLQQGESRLDRRRAEVDQQAEQVATAEARLAEQSERLQREQRQVAERRGEVDRHLEDMREWYRRKLRELAGLDGPAHADEGEAAVLPLPGARQPDEAPEDGGRAVLTLADEIDPGDRQLGELLRSRELVDADTLAALLREARRRRRSLRQLLLAGGYLTLYQIALIEAGNLDALVLGPVRVIDRLRATPREAVYRVFDPRRDAEAVLRHLAEEEMEDAVHPDEFRQRFAAAAAVRHPHVAEVLEVLEVAGRPAVLAESVSGLPGCDWPALAAAPGAWFRLVNQAVLALQTVHAAGLAHGHLEAASFVLTGAGVVKLCGVGEPRWLVGLPADEAEEGPSADLRTLGQIAAGWAAPAPGKGAKAKGLPKELQAVLERWQSDEGYASATELLADLDRAGAKVPAGTTAWDRLLRHVREQAGEPELRQSA